MSFLKMTLSFSVFYSFIIYLIMNIKFMNEGSPFLLLLKGTMFCGILVFVSHIFKYKLLIKKSIFPLILFFIYLLNSINLYMGSFVDINAMLFGTTGGIILFYTFGFLMSMSLLNIHYIIIESKVFLNIFNILFLIFLF